MFVKFLSYQLQSQLVISDLLSIFERGGIPCCDIVSICFLQNIIFAKYWLSSFYVRMQFTNNQI